MAEIHLALQIVLSAPLAVEGIVIRTVNPQPISGFTFCCLHQSWCLYRADGNAECVGNNFYNRTTNNGFEILRTQNNRPGAREEGEEIKSPGQRTHSGRIWIFWFRNSQTNLKIWDLISVLRIMCPVWPSALSMYHSLRRSVTEKQTLGPGCVCGGKKERKAPPAWSGAIHHIYIHFRLTTFP